MAQGNKPLSYFEEKLVHSESIFDGKILHVKKDDITLPDGRPAFR